MRYIVFLFIFCAFFPFQNTSAFDSVNCHADLLASYTGEDWNHAFLLEDEEGRMWQRSILIRKGVLPIAEGETVMVQGTAQPFSEVQIYVFSPEEGDDGSIIPPNSGVCVYLGEADEQGLFSLPIHASLLWANAGQEIVLDAFFRLSFDWKQNPAQTNQNFFVGTHMPPAYLLVERRDGVNVVPNDDPENCSLVCQEEGGFLLGTTIYPETIDANLISDEVFGGVGWDALMIARDGYNRHTYYAGIKDTMGYLPDDILEADAARPIALTAVFFEGLKRALLGDIEAGGTSPELDAITADSLMNALDGEGVSAVTRRLAQNIQSFLVPSAAREDAVRVLVDTVLYRLSEEEKLFLIDALIRTVTASSTEDNWNNNAFTLIDFFTGSAKPNTCLLRTDDSLRKNFFISERGDERECKLVYVHGSTPQVLVNEDIIFLSPDFSGVRIVSSDIPFDAKESWKNMGAPLKYRYEFIDTVAPEMLASACVEKERIWEYTSFLSEKFSLSSEQTHMLLNEISSQLLGSHTTARITLANPNELKPLFRWKNSSGEPLNILELFFSIQSEECIPFIEDFSWENKDYDGVEVGIL